MVSLAEQLEEFVRGLSSATAGLGLFVAAFFDSSLLSLPEVNDVLLVYFSAEFPGNAYFYASMTVLGSVSGASLLYWLARWRGYSMLKRRFPGGRIDAVFKLFARYGVLAVAVPAILPPPFPFKIFVLSSGVLGLPFAHFLGAIAVGRAFRYFGEAFLAVRYGDLTIAYLRSHAVTVAVTAIALATIAAGVLLVARKRRAAAGVSG